MKTLVCPKCRCLLVYDNNSYLCGNGHRFDIAKSGYVNLLLGHGGGGDDREMCRARHLFHSGDHYRCLSERIAEICREHSFVRILDAGCGEGYYLRKIREVYRRSGKDIPKLCGIDLAKAAIDIAAKCEKKEFEEDKIEYAVSGIFDVPALDNSFDCVLSVFAPVPEKEAHRILRCGGCLIVVSPGPRHLEGLKKVLYENSYENKRENIEYDGLTLVSEEQVSDSITIFGENIANLFHMTPYFWKTSLSDKEKLTRITELSTEIEFVIRIYKK